MGAISTRFDRPGNEPLSHAVNGVLAELGHDGTLDRLNRRWLR